MSKPVDSLAVKRPWTPAPMAVAVAVALLAVGCERSPAAAATPGSLAVTQPAGPRGGAPPAKARPGEVVDVDPATLHAAALAEGRPRAGVVVLDVRTPGEVAAGRVPGASAVDVSDDRFDQRVRLMARDRPIYVYCAVGSRSAVASARLARLGFREVYNLRGGIIAWKRAGLPVERPSDGGAARPSTTPAAFDAEVRAKPRLLVDFDTPWCAPCKRMAPRVEAAAKARGLALQRVDIDASPELATREEVVGVPVLALYIDGRRVWRHGGELDEAALGAAIDAAIAGGAKAPAGR